MSNNITVDEKQVLNMFAELDIKKQKQVYRTALRRASGILTKQARTNLRPLVKTSISKKSTKTGKTLSSGIRVRLDKEATQSTVHIMGDYRLKWFEKGTSLRKTKKGYSRGSFKPTYFFRSAKQQSENQIFSEMSNIILESIVKINYKYK